MKSWQGVKNILGGVAQQRKSVQRLFLGWPIQCWHLLLELTHSLLNIQEIITRCQNTHNETSQNNENRYGGNFWDGLFNSIIYIWIDSFFVTYSRSHDKVSKTYKETSHNNENRYEDYFWDGQLNSGIYCWKWHTLH